jgi:hypothetical protein
MQTRRDSVRDVRGDPIPGSTGLLWGNNAAWLCVDCKQLLGNRTDDDFQLQCDCGTRYEIVRGLNRNGRTFLGRALEIRRLN